MSHNVEISKFSVTILLREINFCELISFKATVFAILVALNSINKFLPSKRLKIHKIQTSEILKMLKW